MEVNIKVKNLENLNKSLKDIQNKVQDTEPLMAELSNHLYNIVENSFETQSSPDGKAWSPIKQATYKNYKLPTDKLLYKSGNMQDSLNRDFDSNSATVGLNAVNGDFQYPLTHQFGTDNAFGKGITIEARPFMPIKNDGSLYDGVEDELVDIFEDYIEDALK